MKDDEILTSVIAYTDFGPIMVGTPIKSTTLDVIASCVEAAQCRVRNLSPSWDQQVIYEAAMESSRLAIEVHKL